jgi:hypothetical protein
MNSALFRLDDLTAFQCPFISLYACSDVSLYKHLDTSLLLGILVKFGETSFVLVQAKRPGLALNISRYILMNI